MKEYQYSTTLEKVGRVFFVHALALLIMLLAGNFLMDEINKIANKWFYDKFLSFDLVIVLGIFVLVLLFNYICEFVICKRK